MSSTVSTEPTIGEQVGALAAFLRRTLRFWRVTLGCLLVGGVAFGLFYYFRQPKFRSETVILYAERGGPEQSVESSDVQRGVTLRLRELLMSRPNLERIISRFNLYPDVRQRYGMVDAVEELKKNIDFRAPGGDTFSIAFDGKSAQEAQAVTAELARQVLDGDAELRKNQAKVALEFLVGERKTREAELRTAEEQLAGFMAQHPRFALDTTPLASGAAIRASMTGTPTPPAGAPAWAPRPRAAPAAGDPTPRAPASPGSPAAVSLAPAPGPALPGPSPADEARARAALAAARESLTEKLARYTPAHPDVRAAEAEVQRATERLAQMTVAGPKAAPNPAGAEPVPAMAAAASPPRSQAPSWPRVAPVPAPTPSAAARGLVELETDWLKLTRAVTEARQRYDQLEGQLFRADIQASSATGGHGVHVNVIDPAFLPQTPLPPGRLTLALIFLAGSLLVGTIAAMLFAVFDERVFTERELASVTEVLVHVPRHATRRAYVPS